MMQATYADASYKPPTGIKEVEQEFLDKLHRVFETRLSDGTVDTNKLASDMGFSRRTLYRATQKIIGLPPASYLREYRLRRAQQLLHRGTFETVAEVAYTVGMSQEHFSRLYRARFGVSPSKDRR